VVFFFIDYYAVKKPHKKPNISFIIPCYNDGHLIEDCIKSIYASYDPSLFELIVINDCSTDNSVSVIKKMQLVYDFMFIDMPNNIGKSCALNHASTFARYDIISFVDADAEVNPVAFDDVLRRFATDEHI
jgi:glycosyltransferase involved in cell wall biosynthesis